MPQDVSRAARVGLLMLLAAAVVVTLVVQLSSRSGILHRTLTYRTKFTSIQGLAEGAEVRYEGVSVGRVDDISFSDDPAEHSVIVRFSVPRSFGRRIDRHVHAELKSDGPLGARLLELRRPDVPPEAPLPEGAPIEARQPLQLQEMLDGGADLFANVKSISQSLAVLTNRLVAGEGLFGRLLKDKEFGDTTITDLQASVTHLRELLDAATQGRGLAGQLLTDQKLAHDLTAPLEQAEANLATLSARAERGEGVVGQAFRDDSDLSRATRDFGVAAANMRTFSERLVAPDSLAHALLFDPRTASQITQDLRDTSHHLAEITRKIDAGQGTAGRLLNDPALYDDVSDVVRGVRKSWIVSFVLKRKQKKGFEDRVDRILRDSPHPDADLVELVRQELREEQTESGTGPDAPEPAHPPDPGDGAAAPGDRPHPTSGAPPSP